jgi:hypothetical protein
MRDRHGWFPEHWHAQWAAQGGCCYLCGDPLADKEAAWWATHIDHDHRCCPSGRSCAVCRRGLACASCNTLIGQARDDPNRLIRIALRLRRAQREVDRRRAAAPAQLSLMEGP